MKVAILARGDYSLVNRRVELLRDSGLQVFFISLNDHAEKHSDNYYIRSWGVKGIRYLLAIPSVIKLVRKLKPDVLDLHGASSYGLFSLFFKLPMVVSVYGPDLYDHGLKNKLSNYVVTKVLNNASLLSCSSSSIFNYLKPYPKVQDAKVSIIPYGVSDINDYSGRRKKVREALGFNDRNFVFIHTRRFMEFWRVQNIIEAFLLLDRKGAKLIFLLPEPNEKERSLLSKVKSVLESHGRLCDVCFLQNLPYDEFISYQCAADCFVCVGENDLFANSLIEAMVAKNSLILNRQEAYLEHLDGMPVNWVKDPSNSVEIAAEMEDLESQGSGKKTEDIRLLHELAVRKFMARTAAQKLINEYKALVEGSTRGVI